MGIQNYLSQIMNAVYGKDVRKAIHDAIYQCYEDGKSGELDLVAREGVAEVKANIANPTLLINGDFRNVVNQRGQTTYTTSNATKIYTIDRWYTKGLNVTVNSGFITVENATTSNWSLIQVFEKALPNEAYTLSIKVKSVTGNATLKVGYGDSTESAPIALSVGTNKMTINGMVYTVNLTLTPNAVVEVEWIKLEHGTIATPLAPRLYAEELALCQRYFEKMPYVIARVIVSSVSLITSDYTSTYCRVLNGSFAVTKRAAPKVTVKGKVLNINPTELDYKVAVASVDTHSIYTIQFDTPTSYYDLTIKDVWVDAEIY